MSAEGLAQRARLPYDADLALAPETVAAGGADAARPVVAGRGVAKRLLRRPTFVIGVAVVLFWALAALLWQRLGFDPYAPAGAPLQAPSSEHLLGTDNLGRDMLARVLAGARPTLQVAPLATLLATAAGTALGLVAGYFRGVVDDLLMRSFDVLYAFPGIIAVLLVSSAFGHSLLTLVIAIAIFFTPIVARTVRSAVLVETDKQYVEAARLQGERASWIVFREILPNVLPTVVVEGTIRLAYAIFVSAGLSFLGLGAQPPSPDWGLVVSQNRIFIQNAWWCAAFPALAIATLVVSVNLIADNLREVTHR
ncbi:ABC transporter permease [Conexibacter stalactiti]|uniref:ABC transporter permease n=1 Tax=Conexibacter stalactiti TaxID=1940611 RepID=A0ABU4HP08_9ACTN|nr:ABC transporter permease [Conexibacter stalactiti]MDW5594275.1 ABC transporter permease [Conexibacter stalactiti]MEC5034917.1 ABC transporter permease [Conexibacter stalactiti]